MTDFEAWLNAGIRARHPELFADTEQSPARIGRIAERAGRALDFKSAAAGEVAEQKTDRRAN